VFQHPSTQRHIINARSQLMPADSRSSAKARAVSRSSLAERSGRTSGMIRF
jgi:hypothetical protein